MEKDAESLMDKMYLNGILKLRDDLTRKSLLILRDIELSELFNPELNKNVKQFVTDIAVSFAKGNHIYTSLTDYTFEKLKADSGVLHDLGRNGLDKLKKKLKRTCSVICIGDSNTFFLEKDGWKIHVNETYPIELIKHFKKDDFKFNILNAGSPGLTVKEYKNLLKGNVLDTEQKYIENITVVCLGLNDIGIGLQSGEKFDEIKNGIVDDLGELCEYIPLAYSHKTKIHVMSIPAFNSDYLKQTLLTSEDIKGLNKSVKMMCEDRGLNYISLEGMLRRCYYNDLIHLNMPGRDVVAKAVYDSIKKDMESIRVNEIFKKL